MEELSSIEPVVRKKPGPAAKPKIDVEDLLRRIDNLEELIIRMAKNDMQKFRG
jgi:hypothetical protein